MRKTLLPVTWGILLLFSANHAFAERLSLSFSKFCEAENVNGAGASTAGGPTKPETEKAQAKPTRSPEDAAAMAIISIPLALRRAATSIMHEDQGSYRGEKAHSEVGLAVMLAGQQSSSLTEQQQILCMGLMLILICTPQASQDLYRTGASV